VFLNKTGEINMETFLLIIFLVVVGIPLLLRVVGYCVNGKKCCYFCGAWFHKDSLTAYIKDKRVCIGCLAGKTKEK